MGQDVGSTVTVSRAAATCTGRVPLLALLTVLVVPTAAILAIAPAPAATADVPPAQLELACPEPLPPSRFQDVDPDGTHGRAIACLVAWDVTSGVTATTFQPDVPVNRAQMASFLVRLIGAAGGSLEAPAEPAFDDVTGVHADNVEALAAAGIVRGIGDGRYAPARDVSRAQMASLLRGVLQHLGVELEQARAPFLDVDDGGTHAAAIGAVWERGIARGVTSEHYAPDAPVAREQMATFLMRTADVLVAEEVATVPEFDDPPPPGPGELPELALPTIASLDQPIAGAVGPDGVVYLAERAGTVRPFVDGEVGAAVVDISEETSTTSERGLLGIAFAADGSELYLSYTDNDGTTQLEAIAVEGGVIQPDQRRSVFTLEQPAGNHNGGDVRIGPDGLLYLALGDGGGSGDPQGAGQDLTTPLGSIIRIDPLAAQPYTVPDDNPFVDRDGAAPEIFVYGLRNPWRFAFDPVTDDLWIADVGQSEREEINRLPLAEAAGANLGWNLMEGTREFAGPEPDDHVPPIYEYETRGPEGCAVTGGLVYRGSLIPALDGVYLYADYCNGALRGLALDDEGAVAEQIELGVGGEQVVGFATDADGEVLVFDLAGRVHRLEPA